MAVGKGATARGAATTPPRLAAGGLVSGGRYELLKPHGGVLGQTFWQARDKRLDRDVALTFVDPLPGETPPGSAAGVLDRTVALTRVYSDGLARVLDVIRGRAGGIVVSEWIPGRSLAAAVREPEPDAAVRAMWGLADAATKAEEDGLVLGLDSPDRVRITDDGWALLAFPGLTAGTDARSDIRGLGAVLYTLLTGAWPGSLPDGSDLHEPRDGRPEVAPVDDDDEPVDPTVLRSGVPPESAVLAMRSLDGSTVSSSATIRSMIADRIGGPAHPAPGTGSLLGSPADSSVGSSTDFSTGPYAGASAGLPAGVSTGLSDTPDRQPSDTLPVYTQPDPETLKRRWQIMAGTSAAAVLVIAVLAAWMLGAVSGGQNDTPLSQQLDAIEQAAQASRAADTAEPEAEGEGEGEGANTNGGDAEPAREAASTPVTVTGVTSWQPIASAGTAENSASAANVVDGDKSTAWSTDTYRSQLGNSGSAYKPGIGLLFTLDGEQETRKAEIFSDDDGVRFEIRSADTASPTSLDETTLLGKGTVRGGSGTATIDDPEESQYVLVWITRLGSSGTQAYDASITEVELTH